MFNNYIKGNNLSKKSVKSGGETGMTALFKSIKNLFLYQNLKMQNDVNYLKMTLRVLTVNQKVSPITKTI